MKMMSVGKREGMRENCLLQFCPASSQVLVTEDHHGCYLSSACIILIGGCTSFLVLPSAKFSVILISFFFKPTIQGYLPRIKTLPKRKILTSKTECSPCRLQPVDHVYLRSVALRMPSDVSHGFPRGAALGIPWGISKWSFAHVIGGSYRAFIQQP